MIASVVGVFDEKKKTEVVVLASLFNIQTQSTVEKVRPKAEAVLMSK